MTLIPTEYGTCPKCIEYFAYNSANGSLVCACEAKANERQAVVRALARAVLAPKVSHD